MCKYRRPQKRSSTPTTGSRRTSTSRQVVSTTSKCPAVPSRLEQVPFSWRKTTWTYGSASCAPSMETPSRILDVSTAQCFSAFAFESLDWTFLQSNIDAYAQLMPDFDKGRIRTSAPTIPTRSLRPTSIPEMLRTTVRCGCQRPLKRSSTPADVQTPVCFLLVFSTSQG